jgi:hypothetical protein
MLFKRVSHQIGYLTTRGSTKPLQPRLEAAYALETRRRRTAAEECMKAFSNRALQTAASCRLLVQRLAGNRERYVIGRDGVVGRHAKPTAGYGSLRVSVVCKLSVCSRPISCRRCLAAATRPREVVLGCAGFAECGHRPACHRAHFDCWGFSAKCGGARRPRHHRISPCA